MREVSNKSAIFLRDACAREGFQFDEIAQGIPGLEKIDDGSGRIDWDAFASLMDRFMAKTGMRAVEEAGARTVEDAFAESIRVIAGAFASSRVLYRAIVRWFAPAAVDNLVLTYEDLPDGRARITVEVPPAHRPSIAFFHLTLGSYRAAPRMLGQPDAIVEMRLEERRATYTITPPPDLTILARARRAVKAALGARRAIQELSDQQDQLRASYQALLDSRRDFRAVIDSVPNGVLIHRAGVILYTNPSWSTTLGFDSVGLRLADLVVPSARDGFDALIVPNAERGTTRPEVQFVCADGHVVTLELFPAKDVDFDGRTSSVLVAHDVTEKKDLHAKATIAERMASIGTIAAGVAHEINNPLTYVTDNVRRLNEALSSHASTLPRAELAQMAAEAASGTERVEVIVRDLKTFARAQPDVVGPLDICAILESTSRIAVSEIRQRARLVQDFDAVPLALGNASRLGQVFLNLLINAAHAIPEGHVEENEIRIVARGVGEQVSIEVRDTGAGIAPENLSRIFEPFFTTKPLGVGTGLGLTVCHKIVTSMGGEIVIESIVGQGTTVRVLLPRAKGALQPKRSMRPSVSPARGPRRILVVDDEPLVAKALTRTLRGNDVTVATSGDEALAALESATFDLVFCDLMMPGMSGMELFERVPPEVRPSFIFATGGAFTPRAQQFLATVPNRTIDKPFDAKLIRQIVADLDALATISYSDGSGAERDLPPANDGGARG